MTHHRVIRATLVGIAAVGLGSGVAVGAVAFATTPTTTWGAARAKVGRRDLRLHDLRHSGLTWSAATGATVAELMHRAGHASPGAALRYQHATEDRDRVLADALAALAVPARVVPMRHPKGARKARSRT